MKINKCPVCGCNNALRQASKNRKICYAQEERTANINYYICSNCGAEIDLDYESGNEKSVKNALEKARGDSVSKSLAKLEIDMPLTTLERAFALPPKTLSKWKNQSKKPSAAAAAFVNLVSLFPWLAYVGLADYNPSEAYRVESVAALQLWAQEPEVSPFIEVNENYKMPGISKPVIENYDVNIEPYLGNKGRESYVD